MSERRTGSGWQPLSKPSLSRPLAGGLATGTPPGDSGEHRNLNQLLNVDGSAVVTPFVRLARTHALHAAGEASVAVALAGSLFFSIDPSAARSRVFLYLVCTLAPFALVGPLIGPALDRMRGGRRLMIILTLVLRAILMILMIPNIDSLWLFPIAFAQLVLGKSYAVAKAATVPTTVINHDELVDKNARLAVLSAVAGFMGAAPAVVLQKLLGSSVTLGYAFVIYSVGVLAAFQLPRVVVNDPDISDELLDIRSAGVRLAASATSVLRGVVGFMFFMLAFAFRGGTDDLDLSGVGTAAGAAVRNALGFDLDSASSEPAWKLGLPLAFWGVGILVGNIVAPKFRQRFTEENMILGSIGAIFAAAVAGVWTGGLSGSVLLAFVVGAAPSGAKLAFDSLVQRDAPGANHGAAFGRFETRFQIAWVLGALIPVILKIPLRAGFAVVAVAAAFAGVTYMLGARTVRIGSRWQPPRGAPRARRLRRRRPEAPESHAPGDNAPAEHQQPADEAFQDHSGYPDQYKRQPVGADPYASAFADEPVELPDWAAAVFGQEADLEPVEPPSWMVDEYFDDGGFDDPAPPVTAPPVAAPPAGGKADRARSGPDPDAKPASPASRRHRRGPREFDPNATPPMGTPIDPNLF